MGMTSRARALGASLSIGLWLVVLTLPHPGLASVRCQRDAATGLLTISATDGTFVKVRRAGKGIEVFDSSSPAKACRAGATVNNTDRIELFSDEDSAAFIELSGGPFAPGLTADEDGTSEIEWELSGPGVVELIGGGRSDHFRYMGPGVNLNAGVDRDADLVVAADSATIFAVNGGAGADTIDALGSPELESFAIGGPGDDTLLATPNGAILEGGRGSDRLIGSPVDDLIVTGGGADFVKAAGGPDEVTLTRDGARDRVNCGAGNDLAYGADRLDRLTSCER